MAKQVKVGGIMVDVALGVGRVEQDVKKLNSTLEREFKNIKTKLKSALTFAGAAAAIGGTVLAVNKLKDAMIALADAGETAGSLKGQFEALGGSAESIRRAQEETLGMVSAFDLMAVSSKLLAREIPGVNENFDKIAQLGLRVANAMGVSAKEGIEKVTKALEKGSYKQLEAVGIMTDAYKAEEQYAAAHGLVAEELSDLQKLEAVRIQALGQLTEATDRYGVVLDSVSNAHAAVETARKDAINLIGIEVNESEELTKAWRDVADEIKRTDWEYIGKTIAGAFEKIAGSIQTVLPLLEHFARGVDVVLNLTDTAKIVELGKDIESLKDEIEEAGTTSGKLSGVWRELISGGQLQAKTVNELQSALDRLERERAELIAQGKKELAGLKKTEEGYKATGLAGNRAGEKSGAALRKQRQEADKATRAVTALANAWKKNLATLEQDVFKKGISLAVDLGDIDEFDRHMADIAENFGDSLQVELDEALSAGVITEEQAAEYKQRMTDNFLEPFIDEWDKKEKERQDKQKKQARSFWEEWFGPFASVSDDAMRGWEESFGAALGDAVTSTIASALEVAIEGGSYRPVVTNAIVSFLNTFTGGTVGTMLEPAIAAVVDEVGRQLDKQFGGGTSDPESQARWGIEKFIEDRMRESPLWTFGQGSGGREFGPFGDNFVFGGAHGGDFTTPGWADIYAERWDEDSRQSFQALGVGLTEFLQAAQEIGPQIGLVLQENLVGNLDNAKLLLDTLGVSIDDLKEAILNMAKAGSISWLEFETHMQGLNSLAEEGLVGIGDLEGAFLQLEGSGGRGLASIIGLQNLAIEATEAGIASVDELGLALVEAGIMSQDEWREWANILQNRGITNMEELQNASEATLGGIVADLDANITLFGNWAEISAEVAENVEDIGDNWEDVPTEWHTNYEIKVNVTGDPIPEDLPTGAAMGRIFDHSGVVAFARGGVVSSPTLFRYHGGLGLMGEAGPEAVLPLKRGSSGDLGVSVVNGLNDGPSVQFNIDARGGTPGIEGKILATIRAHAQSAAVHAIRELNRRN